MAIRAAALALLLAGPPVPPPAPPPVATANEQCEILLNSAIPLAESSLREHGEFYPFGVTMKDDGTVASVAASDGSEHPASAPIIELLHEAYRKDAREHKVIATAVVYNVRVMPPGATARIDALAVELDHRDHYSVIVYLPYTMANGTVRFGTAFANAGEFRIFPPAAGDESSERR